ncbi:MAG: lamin tail domain-containing protein, partial [Saprospiraceae bacterium]|nr:lamin tail domain-containing protein [Saprospiraceae bacterium]
MMKTILTGVLCTIFSVIFGQGVVISELYVGGNSGSGLYYSDYVELYNSSESDINVSGWTIQYASETGNFASQTFQLNGIIKSKSFFLIEGTTTHSNGGAVLPVSADNVSTLQFNRNGGKVALVSDNTPLTGANPTTSNIVDLIGYGNSVNGFEGTKLNTFTNLTSAERKAFSTSTASTMAIGGADEFAGNAYDSNNNSTDFVIRTTPQPQNSSSPTEPVNTNGPNLTFNPSSIPFGNVMT